MNSLDCRESKLGSPAHLLSTQAGKFNERQQTSKLLKERFLTWATLTFGMAINLSDYGSLEARPGKAGQWAV